MIFRNIRIAASLVLSLATGAAHAGPADFSGNFGYESAGNTTVLLTADRIENNTTTRTTGTLYLTLRFTTGPDITTTGYNVARETLSYIGDGQLSPGEAFAGISVPAAYTAPPAGNYYAHLAVSEYPNLNTALDSGTFSNVVTIGGGGGDGNDSMAGATAIAPNSSTSGAISAAGEVDFYRITVTSGGSFAAYTTGSTDTTGTLYDAAGSQIAYADDAADQNFSITQTLGSGTYYLKVAGFNTNTGSYTLLTTYTGTGGGGGGGGGGGSSAGVELVGGGSWVTDTNNALITLFQDGVRNNRAFPTGQLSLRLWAYSNQGDTEGYELARYEIGALSAGAAVGGIAATVDYSPPADGSYYTRYHLVETTSSGEMLLDSSDYSGPTDFGGGSGGGGAVSPPMLLALAALALVPRSRRKEVSRR